MTLNDRELQEAIRRLSELPDPAPATDGAVLENATPHRFSTLRPSDPPPLPLASAEERRLAFARDERWTCGAWATEVESEEAFDRAVGIAESEFERFRATRVALTPLWIVYRQVSGDLVHPRPIQTEKRVRIDRVLVPTPTLTGLGWTHGAIGVEVKRSGEKIGPPVSQALDYGRAVWTLKPAGNLRIWLDWVFVWPMQNQGGFVASIMAQNRVGSAKPGYGGVGYQLKAGEANMLYVDGYGQVKVGAGAVGTKAGRR